MAENKVSVWTRENLYVGESELRVQQKSFFPIAIELPSQGSLLFSPSSIINYCLIVFIVYMSYSDT
jgi:hypothetical protein